MVDRTMVLPGMEVYGADEAFIGVVERVDEGSFLMHDAEFAFSAVDRVERDRLIMHDAGTHYHPQAKPDDSTDTSERAGS